MGDSTCPLSCIETLPSGAQDTSGRTGSTPGRESAGLVQGFREMLRTLLKYAEE